MHKPVLGTKEIDKGAEIYRFDDPAIINDAKFRFRHNITNPCHCRLTRRPRDRRHFDRAIFFDINLGTCFFTYFADDFTTRANDIADFINRYFQCGDLWCAIGKIFTRTGQCLGHFAQDMNPAITRLLKRNAHNFRGDRGDFNIHLQ